MADSNRNAGNPGHVNLHQTRIERPGASSSHGRQRGSSRVERAVRAPGREANQGPSAPVPAPTRQFRQSMASDSASNAHIVMADRQADGSGAGDKQLSQQPAVPPAMDLKTAVHHLKRHRRHAGMQKAASQVIRVELRKEDNRIRVANLDLLVDLQAAMRGHKHDVEVQEEAIGAIGNLCFDNDDMRSLAGRLSLLADIHFAMSEYRGRASLQEWAAGAVRNICSGNTDNKARAGRIGLLDDIAFTIKKFSWHMGITHNSLGALRCLASNEDNMIIAGKLGMLPCLRAAIREYRAHVGIQMQAVGALRAMGGTAENSTEAGSLGMLLDLKGMLFDFAWHEVMVDLVAGAVWTLCAVNTRNKAEAGRLGLLADLQAVMQQNPDNKDIQLSASMAAVTLCFNSSSNTAEAKRIGLMQDLQVTLLNHTGRAGTTHPQNHDLQILLNLADEKPLMVLPAEQVLMIESGDSQAQLNTGSPTGGRPTTGSPIGAIPPGPPSPLLEPRGTSRGQPMQAYQSQGF